MQKRIPRTLLALLVGAALGLSGAVMQGVTRNPLADPGILGVTNGAALAVVTGHRLLRRWPHRPSYIWVAIAGAAVRSGLRLRHRLARPRRGDPAQAGPGRRGDRGGVQLVGQRHRCCRGSTS